MPRSRRRTRAKSTSSSSSNSSTSSSDRSRHKARKGAKRQRRTRTPSLSRKVPCKKKEETDLESKEMVEELKPEIITQQTAKQDPPQCLSLAWSTDGQTLFAGYSDNIIRVWQVSVSAR